jgi:hypothetical protein
MASLLHFKKFWTDERGLNTLLLILVLQIFFVFPFLHNTLMARILMMVFYALLLFAGLSSYTRTVIAWIFTFLIFIITFTSVIVYRPWLTFLGDLMVMLYCIVLGTIVLIRTFSEGPITIYRIEGSIVVYLLIGLAFSFIYGAIFELYGLDAFKGLTTGQKREFIYFSFTTLTTVGYGDITPTMAFARAMANMEGLIGQLYPAILIARLVSMQLTSSRK